MGQASMKTVNINHEIKSTKILLIGEDGSNLGIIFTKEALSKAYNLGLDLVEVGNKDNIPVCRIIDFGKWKYEQDKRKKKVVQIKQQIKEIVIRPNIGNNDINYRAKHVDEFLNEGHKVKIVVKFNGREQEHMFETGRSILEKFISKITTKFEICSNATVEEKSITIVIVGAK